MKPKPPVDLWAKMDAIMGPPQTPEPPDESFSLFCLMEKYHLTRATAEARIKKLISDRKIEKCGTWNRRAYYRPL